jgi:hypothetical protein
MREAQGCATQRASSKCMQAQRITLGLPIRGCLSGTIVSAGRHPFEPELMLFWVLGSHPCIIETNRTKTALCGMQNSAFEPYLRANNRTFILVMMPPAPPCRSVLSCARGSDKLLH